MTRDETNRINQLRRNRERQMAKLIEAHRRLEAVRASVKQDAAKVQR